jgi:hypothetical protein
MCSQLAGFIRGSRNEFNYVTMLHFLSDYTPVMMKSSSFTVSAGFLFWSRIDLIEGFSNNTKSITRDTTIKQNKQEIH